MTLEENLTPTGLIFKEILLAALFTPTVRLMLLVDSLHKFSTGTASLDRVSSASRPALTA